MDILVFSRLIKELKYPCTHKKECETETKLRSYISAQMNKTAYLICVRLSTFVLSYLRNINDLQQILNYDKTIQG